VHGGIYSAQPSAVGLSIWRVQGLFSKSTMSIRRRVAFKACVRIPDYLNISVTEKLFRGTDGKDNSFKLVIKMKKAKE
jgi:hypothetical protein